MKKIILIIVSIILLAYFVQRANIINHIDQYSDSFFADFSNIDKEQLKKYLDNNQNIEDALTIITKHKEAISNFDYKNLKPSINLMLNKAKIEASWHLTIVFEKKNKLWYISKFEEYTKN